MKAQHFELFAGCLGNGTTVCNKAVEEHGDYKKVCHISNDGNITWYVEKDYCPEEALVQIENWADTAKRDYDKWWESIGTYTRYEITLDKMSPKELIEHLERKNEARKRFEKAKKRQLEYTASSGGILGLREADDTYNAMNREMLKHYRDSHFEAFIGRINYYDKARIDVINGKSIYERLNDQFIYDFGCDFVVPVEDVALSKLIRLWNEKPREIGTIEHIRQRVTDIGGEIFIWF